MKKRLGKRGFIHKTCHCERSAAIQFFDIKRTSGLPRRYAPRNDDLICASLVGILLLISMPAWAILPYAATPAEQAMCQARVYSRLGERNQNTMHMHHYCDGLRFFDRAQAAMGNKQDMKYT